MYVGFIQKSTFKKKPVSNSSISKKPIKPDFECLQKTKQNMVNTLKNYLNFIFFSLFNIYGSRKI